MQSLSRILAGASVALLCSTTFASTTTYSSSDAFLAQVQPGSYTEMFSGLGIDPPTSYAGNGFSYSVSAPSGIYSSGDSLGSNQTYETLTISFTGLAVSALGGNFFAVNYSNDFMPSTITLTLSDNSSFSFSSSSMDNSYFGFTSDSATISSVSISVANLPFNGLYVTMDNLTVGQVSQVPEPAAVLMLGLGLGLIGLNARRRLQR